MDPLLKILQEDATHSIDTLAKMLGSTEDEVRQRIHALTEDHSLLGYRAILNEEKLGTERVRAVIEVKITPEREGGFDHLAKRIAKHPEVKACYLMSGGYDLMVIVEGSTLKQVASFVSEKLATLNGVVSTATHFLLKPYKEYGVMVPSEETPDRLPVTP